MSRNKCTRSGSKLMVATLVFAQMLSGLAPLFTFSVQAEGITEPTPMVQEESLTPTEIPLPTVSPVPTVEPSVVPNPTLDPATMPTEIPIPTETGIPIVGPTVLPESVLTPTPNITTNPFEKVCSTGNTIRTTLSSDWKFDSATGIAETKSKVELGVTYVFPLDSKVTITFNCLPKDENLRTTLKIERMSVSELNLPEGTNTSSDFAYDITTGMVDGLFKYDVTLPKPAGTDAEVSYMENVGSQLIKIEDSKLDQSGESVKANDLDHFTIFVVVNPDSTDDENSVGSQDSGWVSDDAYATFDSRNDWAEYGFSNLGIPIGSTIDGIEVLIEGKTNGRDFDISVFNKSNSSPDGYTSTKLANLGLIESTVILGSPSDKWGKTWIVSDFDNDFKVKVDANSGGGTASLDMVQIKVYYTAAITVTPPVLPNNPTDDYALTSVTGVWTGITGGSGYSGLNTNEIRWGTPSGSTQSGLKFTNSGIQTFNEGNPFYLGMLTHFNWGTMSGTAANGATLKITLTFSKPGGVSPQEFSYDFDIEETSNSSGSCPSYQISSTPCDDKITFPNSYGSTSFQIGSKLYTLRIDGFVNAFPSGTPVTSFITEEQRDNSAFLIGSLSSVLVAAPQISLVQKSVNGDDADSVPGVQVTVGDIVNFTYDLQNTGNVTLSGIVVHDDKGVVVTCPKTTLLSGESMTCTGSGTAILGQYTNIAHAHGYYSSTEYTSNTEPANYFGKVAEYCGDGIVNGTEQCDGTQGLPAGGEFQCANSCEIELINPKVTICHASDSNANPYITNQPNKSADVSGHDGHNGPIWYHGITESWGDIIPPFSYIGGVYAGKNWTTEGQAIWNNGCSIPEGTIKIIKVVVPQDSSMWNFLIDGPTANTATGIVSGASSRIFNSKIGSYKVTETGNSGGNLSYYNTTYSCSDGTSVIASGSGIETSNFSLLVNKNIVCTFTNTLKASHLNVIKHVINNNGGNKVASNFTITVTGNSSTPSSFSGVESPGTSVQLLAGSYSVVEGSHDGYTVNYSSDCSGSINPGETKTCTITNDDLPGTLTVVKNLVNDNGGDAVNSYFSFKVTGSDNVTKEYQFEADGSNEISVDAGTFNIVENSADGYTTTYSNCSNIAITNGGSATCTITNNDNAPKLTLVKLISKDNGGTALATDWTLKASSVDYGYFEGRTPVSSDIRANTAYTLSESGPTGYSASAWSCTGGSLVGDVLTLDLGDDVTCTITNDDLQGKLIIRKVVTNDNGGQKTAEHFSFSYNSSSPIAFEADGENQITVNSGYYTVTETTDDAYTTSYDNCEDIFVPNDGTATCTITNNDKAGTLIVKKIVNNYFGGTLGFADFSFQVGTDNAIKFDADGINELTVSAGTYTVTEPAVEGYEAQYSNCGQIEVTNGGTTTCTITNSDIAPKLTLVKQITNDNGGKASATDWTLSASSDNSPVMWGATPISSNLIAGKTYVLSESGPTGYSASDWECNGGSLDGNNLVLGLDDDVTCTITNDDQAGTLIVKKVLVNDNGGTKTEKDFSFKIGDSAPIQFDADGENQITVNAGIYNVTEFSASGYTTTYDKCSNINVPNGGTATCTITNDDKPGTLIVKKVLINNNGGSASKDDFSFTYTGSGVINFEADGENRITVDSGTYSVVETPYYGYNVGYDNCTNVFVPNGRSATCTITNNDIQPKLKVTKVVINDNGGTKVVSDFPLYVNTTRVNSGSVNGFNAGWKRVSEIESYGYNATISGDCSSNGWVELNVGDEKACTITNNDIQPVLIVKKYVDNDYGGTLNSSDFTLHTDNASGTTVATFSGSQSGERLGLDAGIYRVWEDSEDGYKMTENCGSRDSGIIELKVGDVKTCTVKNHDIQPKLNVIKHVINNNGGEKHAYDFWITVDGSHAFPFLFWGRESGTSVDLHAGEYDVKEFTSSQYAVSYSEGCSGTIAIGEEKTCTITNDDIPPLLKIVKTVINDDGGTLGVSDFTFNVDGNDVSQNVTDNSFITLNAGRHFVGEAEVYGYESGVWGGDCRWDGKVYLLPGDVKTCTITNDDIAPKLTVLNYNDQNGDGVWNTMPTLDQPVFGNEFQLLGTDNSITLSTDVNGEIHFTGFTPGDYQLNNTLWENWRFTNITCSNEQSISDLHLSIGDDVVCEFGQQTSALLISKTKDAGDPANYRVGDLVNFIIKISVPSQIGVAEHEEMYNTANMQNVVVRDIPSRGFEYSLSSMDYPDSIEGENGIWNIGEIISGGSYDIKFALEIGSSIDPGDYKDLAWAKGQIGGETIDFEEGYEINSYKVAAEDGFGQLNILALDASTQTTYFVGQTSNVIEDPVTPEQGVVLGQKTVRLPRTGIESFDIVIISIIITGLGAAALVMSQILEKKQKLIGVNTNFKGKFKMKKNILKLSAFLGISLLFLAFGGIFNPVHAQDLQTLKIEQPESPTNKASIEVTYVAYDLSDRDLNVKCSIQKLPAGAVTIVTSVDPKASSEKCIISNSLISENGDYLIKAFNDVDGGKTASVTVTVDRVLPPAPVSYNKVSPESCKNRIDFTTGIDSDATPTTKVDIFRGESTNFIAGPLTLLESIDIGPGISGSSSVYSLPDCSKTYYYAIQAVDSIGNRSSFVGDVGINVVYYITTTPTPTGSNVNGETNGNVTPTPGTSGGPNGGVDTGNNNGLVEGATDNNDQARMNTNLMIIFIVIGAIVLAGFIFEIKLNKEPGK